MTIKDAKICRECGSLDWVQKESCTSTRYGHTEYLSTINGIYDTESDTDDDNDDYGDWEDSEDPVCAQCNSETLEDLQKLTPEEFKILYELPPERRVEIADKMLAGTFQLKTRKNAKYIGGAKVFQC